MPVVTNTTGPAILVCRNRERGLELPTLPSACNVGDPITAPPYVGEPEEPLSKAKWSKIAKLFTSENGNCQFRQTNIITPAGPVTTTLKAGFLC